jgi:hypothetical protein
VPSPRRRNRWLALATLLLLSSAAGRSQSASHGLVEWGLRPLCVTLRQCSPRGSPTGFSVRHPWIPIKRRERLGIWLRSIQFTGCLLSDLHEYLGDDLRGVLSDLGWGKSEFVIYLTTLSSISLIPGVQCMSQCLLPEPSSIDMVPATSP